jgi:hypothetical protein
MTMMDQQAMQRRMSSSGAPQGGPQPPPGGAQEAAQGGGGGEQGPAKVIQMVDSTMGQIGEAMGKIPGGEQLPKEMDGVRSGFRSVCEKAIQLSQGGGGAQQQPQGPQQGPPPPQGPQQDRSQGVPAGPAGMR